MIISTAQISPWTGVGLPGSRKADGYLAILRQVKGLILDVDGVLFEGERTLPGAAELAADFREAATPHVFLSNNSTFPLQYHIDKLARLGFPYPPGSIITAARVTAHTLRSEARLGTLCLVIGERGLMEAMSQAGFEITQTDYQRAEYVVIGMDRQLTYEKLKCAALAIRRGAQFISSNPDPNYPDGVDLLPSSGALQAALEASTGVRARVTGKPALPGYRMALERLGTDPTETAMLGDQLEIDIQGAAEAGLKAFLVLSSLTPVYRPQDGEHAPDAIFGSTLEFYHQWKLR